MRKFAFFLLLIPSLAYGQSVRYQGQVIGARGPIGSTSVAVCTQPATTSTTPCSPLATLATSTSTTSGGLNPTTTDQNGNFFFYAPSGTYTIQIYGPQLTSPFVQPDVNINGGSFTVFNINGEVYVDGSKYACSAAGINAAIIAAASSIGGIVHVNSNCSGMNIASNLWATVTNPVKVIWEPPATFTAQQILPTNTEFAGAGWQTVLTIGASANWAAPEALFVNAAYLTYGTSSGHDTGISIHDFFVDGSANTLATEVVGFRGADNSQIYNLYMKNISHNAIDLRDGTANDVHDNWCVGCGTFGAPYHAIGGGIFAATGIFLHNKFTRNHVSGGGTSTDHFDIFGQGAGVRCGFNVFAENTSDASPSQAFFLDTCNNNTLTGNIARNALQQGFAVTTGTANLDGGASRNTFSANIINNSAAACYLFSNNSNNNSVSGGSCILSAKDGVLIQDSSYNEITGVEISGPGQLLAATYSGVKITNGSATAQASNFIHNNLIQDLNAKMQFGVNVLPAAGGTQTSNNVHDNFILGGAAGSVGNGVQDTGTTTVEYGDQYGSATAFFNFYGMGSARPGNDILTDLGVNGFRWRNLHIGGYISSNGGTNQIAIPLASGTIGVTIASGTSTLTAATVTTNTCQTTVTTAAANVLTTDSIEWGYQTAAIGSGDALLIVSPFPTAGNVNFTRCNASSASQTGSAIIINWRVVR